ncbi:MAG: methylmalonyl-CoA mutase family protein [Acidobacteriota bacterium]|nr:methylmalonyl-CoA mutase family protein [Blastocatellia bacterium]MDW8239119.1 methylmalonyl-CoA mutase family protein [Acidobacteriota bacterium]
MSNITERKPRFVTSSQIELKPVYRADDIADTEPHMHIGEPGQYPFTRGIHAGMYRQRLWTMRQYAGFATAKESNRRYKYLLEQGQMGLSVAFDLPTQMGLDSDHPLARGEVGKVGVAIDSLRDMEVLFDGIPLDKVSTSMTINSTAAILLALYLAVARQQGIPFDRLSGTVQNDILKEYIARGTYIYPPKPSLRLVVDVIAFCQQHVPKWNTISISGYHIREAGSTAVQELAFTFANAITYVQAAIDAGLNVDDFGPRLSFFFNAHNNFLEEIAKYRAARRLWARIMKERFGARDPRSMMLRFHAQTAGSTLTAQQPDVNVVRVTLQALAAVLGGTQSLHCNARDEALGLPTEDAARLALRTQQVIAYESGVADTVDPLGGSYAVESLTNEIERRASEYLDKIDALGGMLKAIEIGWVQGEIERAAYEYQQALERQEEIVVGVNKFTQEQETPIEVLRIDPEIEREQIASLRRVKAERDHRAVETALEELQAAASTNENLMPYILRAVQSYATVGEISDRLRRVYGEYREVGAV